MKPHTGLTGEVLDCIGTAGKSASEVSEILWRRPEYQRAVNRSWLISGVYHVLWNATKKGWCFQSSDKPAKYAKMPT